MRSTIPKFQQKQIAFRDLLTARIYHIAGNAMFGDKTAPEIDAKIRALGFKGNIDAEMRKYQVS